MWSFKKSPRKRRIDLHKKPASRPLAAWRRFSQAGGPVSAVLLVVFFAAMLIMDAWPMEPLTYRTGQHVPEDIRARVTFRVLSEQRLRQAQDNARRATPATFRPNEDLLDEIASKLRQLPERIRTTTQPADLDESIREQFALEEAEQLETWHEYAEGNRRERLEDQTERLRQELRQVLIVPEERAREQIERMANRVRVLYDDNDAVERNVTALIGLQDTGAIQREAARLAAVFDDRLKPSVEAYLLHVFIQQGRPLYHYNADRTMADVEEAVKQLAADPPSEVFDIYERGDVLVYADRPTGLLADPSGLTSGELELLRTEHRQYLRQKRQQNPYLLARQVTGRAVILLLITAAASLYVFYYHHGLLTDHWRAFALVATFLLMLAVNKGVVWALEWNEHTVVLPVLMGGVVLGIAFDRRFALAGGTTLALLAVLQVRAPLEVFIVPLAGVTTAVFQLHEVRTRSKLIQVSAISAAAVFAATMAVGMFRGIPLSFPMYNALWAGGSALAVGLIIQAMLPLVERFFRVATSMTLLEWCDASRPLLRRLAMEAPGTYNHSLQLGAMCEAAADAIGARGLLARVGAYYHDIGKINKPEYFIENQTGASKHAKLSPAMSLLVIIGHVKDGLEMAREYGLPHELHEFITAHHGTTLVHYFYQQAAEQRKADADRAPDDVEFRYPGPKPRHKEPAILMLADAAESSVRAMSDPTPGRIENQVHAMVARRLQDGQLNECELMLREVHQIEASLVKSLCSIYHSRIAYPTPAGEKPSAAENDAARKQTEDRQQPEEPADSPQSNEARQRAGQE